MCWLAVSRQEGQNIGIKICLIAEREREREGREQKLNFICLRVRN